MRGAYCRLARLICIVNRTYVYMIVDRSTEAPTSYRPFPELESKIMLIAALAANYNCLIGQNSLGAYALIGLLRSTTISSNFTKKATTLRDHVTRRARHRR